MPIARRATPPTSQIKEQLSLLNSLSAWTDPEETEEKAKKALKDDGGYRELGTEGTSASQARVQTIAGRFASLTDVESDNFNILIGVVIICNAFVIGLETDFGRSQFQPFEHAFNTIFLFEAGMRVRQLGRAYFLEPWNIFDCLLVFIGSLDLWILPLLTLDGVQGEVGYKLSVMRMLRVLRLLRVLRVIRLFRMFHQLYLILQAFNKAFQMVMLISLLVFILDYVCAIVLTQAVGQHAADYGEDEALIAIWFGTISRSMQSLFLIMTLSDWSDMPLALMGQMPTFVVIAIFILYIMVTSYTMVSLISGIISESLITSQQEYKRKKLHSMDEKRKEVAGELRDFLYTVNEEQCDQFNCVSGDDLKQSVRGDQELLGKLAAIGISVDEKGIMALVDQLSSDGTVRVSIDHFVDKLTNLLGQANASLLVDLKHEVIRTEQAMNLINKKLVELANRAAETPEAPPPPPPKKEEEKGKLPVPPLPDAKSSGSTRSSLRKDKEGGRTPTSGRRVNFET